MSSPLEKAVANVQAFDYTSFMIIAAVGYDYIITFSDEIDYIWCKPWTWVSTLFILARYSGLCSAMLHAICVFKASYRIHQSDLIDQRAEFHRSRFHKAHVYRCNIIFIAAVWCFWIFLCSADLVMVMRLWALYNRSQIILGTLLTLYAVEVIAFFLNYVISSSQLSHDSNVRATQELGSSTCVWEGLPLLVLGDIQTITQLVLGSWMCILVIVKFIKESIQTYKVTRRCQLSHYQRLLIWEGLVYYIVILQFAMITQLSINARIPTGDWQRMLCLVIQTLPFMLFPRLVLNLRDLHARDIRNRQGDALGSEISVVAVQNTEQADGIELEYWGPARA